ncbi:T3P18.3 [Arabidopsis thaliana]|uniref:T3P18.3 n=1 Tax=Arabidopsis thaliana TaxID=3702 RepID=Q9SXF0_ARATH|nr:T3P18.3 [Arabidopsis thaliana]
MAPAYPFPDNVHVSSSVTLKLNDSNYLLWKTQFESLLSSQKLIGFVNGVVTPPAQTRLVVNDDVTSEVPNPQYEDWFCTDQLVRSWLFGTLSEEVLGHVHNLTTSRQIWISLAENFNKSSIAREFSLRRNLQLLTKKDKSLSLYCRDFKIICDSLSSIGKPVEESMKIFGFLNGLGREYDPITTVIQSSLSKLPAPTYNDVISEVQGFDTHITASTSGLQNATTYEGNDAVLVGDGTYLPITHVGSTTISSSKGTIPLNEVLVCPAIQKSLLSVSKLCDDYPCGVYFDANKVCIIDLTTQKVVSKGPRNNGLYMLENSEFVALYSNRQCAASMETWHHRLGHSNSKILQQLLTRKEIQVNKSRTSPVCEPCQMGKSTRLQFFSSDFRALKPLDRVHCDLWGPSPVVSNQKLVENQLGTKIKEFQSDGGGEFTSNKLKEHFREHGIHHRISCPYTPQQNGVAERKHRHLVELGLSMLYHSHTPLKFWVEAFFTANYLSNLLPSSVLKEISPYETLFQQKVDYTPLRVFGTACYPCLRPLAKNKFDPRSLQCVFLGYHNQYKGYRCLYPPTGKVYISRHVIFDEAQFPFKEKYHSLVPKYQTTLLQAWQHTDLTPPSVPSSQLQPLARQVTPMATSENQPMMNYETEEAVNVNMETSSDEETESNDEFDHEVAPVLNDQNEDNALGQGSLENLHPMITRSKDGIQKPNPRYALIVSKSSFDEPKTITTAMKHPGWNAAVMDEIDRIHMLNTWSLVPATEDMNILTSKWVFKTKLKPDGTIDKLKARLVAKGFDQEEGVDYLETFSPVVRTATIRLVLDTATANEWPLKQLDVSNAFLHGELQEPVFMFQPSGFVDPNKPNHVCRLTKALYGLKQAPRAWFDTFSNFLLDFGFECSTSDPSLFVCHQNGQSLILLLYVDDILLTGSDQLLMDKLLQALNNRFSMKDLGPPRYFLGIEIESYNNGLFLHQHAYASDILHQAGMTECNPMPTPLPQHLEDLNSEPFEEPTYFRSLAGKLQYLTITRPDIQYAVNFICQRMHAPTNSDFGLLKRILRYVKGTINMGLPIRKHHNPVLSGFCDSDYAGCKDTRRSTTGFCILLGSTLISWSAKRQPTISHSSTEAEYRALSDTAREITWISSLLRDLGISQHQPTRVFCDNLSAVYLSANPALHKRSKHFDKDFHYIRERVALGLIETQHIPATIQLADVFTKSLPRRPFITLRAKLGVSASPVSPTPSLKEGVEDNPINRTGFDKNKDMVAQTQQSPLQKPSQHMQKKIKTKSSLPAKQKTVTNTKKKTITLENKFKPLQSLPLQ